MPEDQLQGNENSGAPSQPTADPRPVVMSPRPSRRWLWIAGGLALLVVAAGLTWWFTRQSLEKKPAATNQSHPVSGQASSPTEPQIKTEGLALDTAKQYGDKYKNGLLPVGDNKYATDGAKKGYIYMCSANFVPASQAGAQTRGPWFTNNNTQWDLTKKVAVKGAVSWQPNITVKIENGKRVVTTNDLPDHHTGSFPVASSDPAYAYDRNPNSIQTQSLTYSLAAKPLYGQPQCMGGEVGVMLSGAALFNGFDAGGRDAGAWEIQDLCDGHPQSHGEYHYHTLSRCVKDTSVSTVIGYALDGFPITGPKVGEGNYLTTDDLDECHGIVSLIILDGKEVTTYHYVMTQDFPYSASCFRATAIQPPGQSETQGAGAHGGTATQTGGTGTGTQQPPPAQPYSPPR